MPLQKQTVLVTGGAGFIGSHLVRGWMEEGATVRVLDNFRSGHASNLKGLDCELVEGSVENAETVRKVMRGCDYVHHLAALVSVPESMDKPGETERINVLGTLNVLQTAREEAVRKVVFSSTSAVYGMVDRPLHRETDLPQPLSPYAISKLAAEHYCMLFDQSFGLKTTVLRYFNVYGPRQDPNSPYAAAVATFTNHAQSNKVLTIHGDGNQTRDFVFVEDVVRANIIAAKRATGLFNVATGGRMTVNDLATEIVRCAGSASKIVHETPRLGDVRHSCGDSSRLRALGWKPLVTLAEGLDSTIRSFGVEVQA